MDDARLSEAAHAAAARAARDSYGRLIAVLAAGSGDLALAEDALGDAFASALERWPQGGIPENPEGWLITVARRHTWRLLDRNRRKVASEHVGWAEATTLLASNDREGIEGWELSEWLNHGLSLVSKDCRNLLSALYLDHEQPSYADVAARLGMAVGSVGPTRIRCLKRLRQVLGD